MKNAVLWDVASCRYCLQPAAHAGSSLADFVFFSLPRRRRRYDPPKRRFIQYLHGATSQKTVFFSYIVI
jgi:hypothetical protein